MRAIFQCPVNREGYISVPYLPWGLYLNGQTTTRATSAQWWRRAVGKQQRLLSGQENRASSFHCTLPVHGLLTCNFSLWANNKNKKFDDLSLLQRGGDEMEQQKKTWNINGAWHRRQMHVTQSIIFAWNVIRKKKKRRRKKRTNTRMYAHKS